MDHSSFSALVISTTRSDGYVDATKWCKKFDYRLDNWKKLPETKARIKALQANTNFKGLKFIIVSRKGGEAITWIHPIMAIHLASYLSPEFANYVGETFQRYLEADATLAIEIIDRVKSPEDLKKIEQRARTKLSNRGVNSAIKLCGGEKVYPVVADMNNIAVTGQTAKDIKLARNVKQTRDGMSLFELSMIEAAENLEEVALRNKRPKGDKPIAEVCREVSDDIHALVKKYTRK